MFSPAFEIPGLPPARVTVYQLNYARVGRGNTLLGRAYVQPYECQYAARVVYTKQLLTSYLGHIPDDQSHGLGMQRIMFYKITKWFSADDQS